MKVFVLSLLLLMAAPIRAAILFSSWEKLLHFSAKSEVNSSDFFLSSEGRTNSAAEMQATIAGMKNPDLRWGKAKLHPQCLFPARLEFLLRNNFLKINEIPKIDCPDFKNWSEGIKADSLSLIFSSSYANNPASAFGHTFIRFNQEGNTHDLLNYAAAYSAYIDSNDNGFVYAFKGVTGGYPGTFSLEPYYMKVASYNDQEGRDLIEYQLDFTKDEVSFLVKHLWELYATAVFPYRFFDRNCSSVLGAYLEVVDPTLKLANANWWYYLPSELVLRLEKSGRIKKIIFRPSLKKQIEQMWETISKSDHHVIKEEFFKSSDENVLNKEQLDILLKLSEFRRIDEKNEISIPQVEQEKKWLLKRSQITISNKVDKNIEDLPSYNRPELSHSHRKIHIGQSKVGGANYLSIKFFNGHHDLLDNDLGHEPFSHFSFVNPSLSHNFKSNKWSWKNSDFINITSMPAMRFYHKQVAWKVRSGIEEVSYSHPENEKLAVSGGAGIATDFNHKSFLSNFAIIFGAYNDLLFSGLGIEAKKWRLGLQGDAIFAADFAPGSSLTYKTVIEYRYRRNLLSSSYSDPSRIIFSHGLGGQKGQILLEHGYEFTGYWQNSFKVGCYF